MSLAAVQQYVKSLISDMPWPTAMAGVPNLIAHITPPNPDVQAAAPVAYVWMTRGRESRDSTRLRGGTVPRISGPGGPSGTKIIEHQIPVWLKFNMESGDPDIDNLVPGLMWQVMAVFRGAAYGSGGTALADDPVLLTCPWTGEQSWLIDIGENMNYDYFDRTLEPQRLLRLDGVIDLSVSELIAA